VRQKVAKRRIRKTRARIQRKRAAKKAEGGDTRSLRRALKRLSRTQSDRTRTFCQTAAKRLLDWAPDDAIVVLENLAFPQQDRHKPGQKKANRRRLAQFPYALLRRCIEGKAAERGLRVVPVDPRHTSQDCSRCGERGERRKHHFSCPHCGHAAHTDINAAGAIARRYTVPTRGGGSSSVGPEARTTTVTGKPPASAGGRWLSTGPPLRGAHPRPPPDPVHRDRGARRTTIPPEVTPGTLARRGANPLRRPSTEHPGRRWPPRISPTRWWANPFVRVRE